MARPMNRRIMERTPLYALPRPWPHPDRRSVADSRKRLAAKKYLMQTASIMLSVLNLYPTWYLQELCVRVRDGRDPYLDDAGSWVLLMPPRNWRYEGYRVEIFDTRREAEEVGVGFVGAKIYKG